MTQLPAIGISTGCVPLGDQFELLDLEPDFIELYNLDSALATSLAEECRSRGMGIACHTPVPHGERRQQKFVPHGSDRHAVGEAIEATFRTIDFAAEYGAIHVLVHFPSPYNPPEAVTDADIHGFFDPIVERARGAGVRLIVENLSANPYLCTAEHYLELLTRLPEVGLCLDLAHAHLLEPATSVEEFIRQIDGRISSVHVSNTTVPRRGRFGGEAPEEFQNRTPGWIPLDRAVEGLLRISPPPNLVLEVTAQDDNNINKLRRGMFFLRMWAQNAILN